MTMNGRELTHNPINALKNNLTKYHHFIQMHITIQKISIWTKHQSTIIKPKTEPINNQTKNIINQWLWYFTNTPQVQCSLWPADVGRSNTIPYKSKNHVRTSNINQHCKNQNEWNSPKQ